MSKRIRIIPTDIIIPFCHPFKPLDSEPSSLFSSSASFSPTSSGEAEFVFPGLSKYREGLYPLEPFTKEDACEVIDIIESYQKRAYKKSGLHFVHASDEWYITAQMELPEEERYDGYLQIA